MSMKTRLILLTTLIGIMVIVSAMVVAQDDPTTNLDDNWCFEGGPWGDGRCNPSDPYIQGYYWLSGWCHAQDENGNLTVDVSTCVGEIPVVVESTDDDKSDKKSSSSCQATSGKDIKFTGKYNKFENIKFYDSTDGSCKDFNVGGTVVNTADPDATCKKLIKKPNVIYGSGSTPAGSPFPSDAYYCTYSYGT